MLAPEDKAGCPGCSFMADNFPSHLQHLNAKDTTLVMVSRAPYEKIKAFKERMGWPFSWYSSYEGDFNYDFHVTNDEEVTPVMYNVRTSLSKFPCSFCKGKASANLVKQYKTKEEMANDKHKMTKGEGPGLSVFFKEGDEIFHTYSTYARGLDTLLVTHRLLDITPLGRQEGDGTDWKLHDEYDEKETKACH